MDKLVEKIRDLEKEAVNLAKQQVPLPSISEDVASFAHWIQGLRSRAGGWTAGPLVVLSLFDGIGGIWNALSLLGIPFKGYSCEVNTSANQVVKARFPMVHHVGDVMNLELRSIPEKVDLVVGGFPCQDLSSMGHKMGLHGRRSRLFFEMLRIIKLFKPTWFLAENVASMAWQDRDEISKHLKTIPIEIDSQELTPSRRRRIYWSNIPYPRKLPHLRDHESTSLQSVLKNATALDSKVGCILSQNGASGVTSLDLVMDNATCALRYITVTEVEKAMGYPPGYTNVKFHDCNKDAFLTTTYENGFEEVGNLQRKAGDKKLRNRSLMKTVVTMQRVQPRPVADGVNKTVRWALLGNTFSVNVIAYLLSPLLERAGRAILRPISLPRSIKEEHCSAMEPGEVWALYNSHERPNWYALIVSRSGDRFSFVPGSKRKSPIHIEVKFMELTDLYSAEEPDEWDTIRGTGLFLVRPMVDQQNSWVAFSHRIDNFLKFDDLYFIYPAMNEVWAVYDPVAGSRYLVFVMQSYVDRTKAKQGKPGKESFHARCRPLLRIEKELYKFQDKEIDYADLAAFAFRAPYVFKSEGTLLKIELTTRQRRRRNEGSTRQSKRRKRHSDSESEEDEEVDAEDVEIADIMGGDGSVGLGNFQECGSPTPST